MSQTVTSSATVAQGNSAAYTGPSPSTGGAGTGGTGSGTTLLLPDPPKALSALNTGQVIRAVATGQTSDEKALLDTRFGQISVKLPFTPERGAVLRLQITQGGTPTHLTLVDQGAATSGKTSGQALQAGDLVTVRSATTPAVPAAPGQATPPADPKSVFQARIDFIGSPPPGETDTRAGQITGRVVSSPPGGPTLLQTASGRLLLPGLGNLPPGTELGLRPVASIPASAAGSAPLSGTPGLTTLGSAWTALEDVHAILQAADASPVAATAVTPGAIPTTGPQLASGMLFFMNALFHGSVQEWLGRESLRLVGDGERQGLARRLSDDFAQLSRIAAEPPSGEWRMAILPLMDESRLQQIRLYIRQLSEDSSDGEQKPGTRFVVEAALSRLGAIQLDGLVRASRFDLVVRTHAELPAQMREDISRLFADANREFRATGRVDFRVENPFGVQPGEAGADAAGVYA